MGKRKSSTKAAPKSRKEPLSTSFKCLFCQHEKAVTVSMKKDTMFGELRCKDCGVKFQAPINNLSAPVDIYAEWVDACEDERSKQPVQNRTRRNPDTLNHGYAGGARMTLKSNAAPPERDADRDDDEADGDDDDNDDAGRARERTGKDAAAARDAAADDEDDEEELDDEAADERAKRRRREYDDDEDEDD